MVTQRFLSVDRTSEVRKHKIDNFLPVLYSGFNIQMVVKYSDQHLNTGLVFKCWSEYRLLFGNECEWFTQITSDYKLMSIKHCCFFSH